MATLAKDRKVRRCKNDQTVRTVSTAFWGAHNRHSALWKKFPSISVVTLVTSYSYLIIRYYSNIHSVGFRALSTIRWHFLSGVYLLNSVPFLVARFVFSSSSRASWVKWSMSRCNISPNCRRFVLIGFVLTISLKVCALKLAHEICAPKLARKVFALKLAPAPSSVIICPFCLYRFDYSSTQS